MVALKKLRSLLAISFFLIFPLISLPAKAKDNAHRNDLSPYEEAEFLIDECERLYLSNIDTLKPLALNSLRLLELPLQEGDDANFRVGVLARTYNVLGFYHDRKGNIKQSLDYYLLGIKAAERISDLTRLEELYNNVASVYLDIGAYDNSFSYYSKSLLISIQLNDLENTANMLDNMSFIFQAQRDLDKALFYREKALEIRKDLPAKAGISRSYNNIGLVYQLRGEFNIARELYRKSLLVNQQSGDLAAIAINYDNIGSVFSAENQHDSAIVYYNQNLSLSKDLGIVKNIVGANISLSKAYRKKGNYQEALKHAAEAYQSANEINNPNLLMHACNELSVIHENLGNYQKALDFVRIGNELNETHQKSIFERKILLKEELLEFSISRRMERIKMEREIAQNKSESQRKLMLYLSISFLTLLIILFLLYWLRQKQKLTASQLELSSLKEKRLEEELATKQRKLTSISVRVTQNNQYLEKVNSIIKDLDQDELNSGLNNKLHDLKRQIKESTRIDEDWINFQRQFDGVHTEFSKELMEKFPQLTANEVKLCRLMKLNMNSAEIAILLNVSSNTLRSSRYRIHKKMNLEKGTKLQDFLLKMG